MVNTEASEVERHTAEAVRAQVMLERARALVEEYQLVRDGAIRAAAAAGADRSALAREVGITRRLIYVAIDAPRDDDEARAEWFEAKAEAAEDAWAASGFEGTPDDYWLL